MGLALKSSDIVFLDTAPFIYFFERHEQYFPAIERFFNALYDARAQAITSIISYMELTTLPARLGNQQLVRKYRDYLSHSENVALFPLDMNIADYAVNLRSRYGFKTPDAIQLGTALACGADYVITNHLAWRRLEETGVKIVLVEEM